MAVLGTGIIGSGIARSLLAAGLEVTVWNRTPGRAEPLRARGAQVAASAEEAVNGASVVITMLPDAAATTSVMARAIGSFSVGSVWVQMGTVGLTGIHELAALARAAGVALVDAPVSGSREPAESGQLLVLASGPQSVRDLVRPAFAALGRATVWVGEEAGPATALKLVVNDWLLNLLGSLGEALLLADALGLDPKLFLEAISGGPLDAAMAQAKGAQMMEHHFPPSFPLYLAEKDAELILQVAGEHGLALPMTGAVAGWLARARSLGHGDQDVAAVFEVMADS